MAANGDCFTRQLLDNAASLDAGGRGSAAAGQTRAMGRGARDEYREEKVRGPIRETYHGWSSGGTVSDCSQVI